MNFTNEDSAMSYDANWPDSRLRRAYHFVVHNRPLRQIRSHHEIEPIFHRREDSAEFFVRPFKRVSDRILRNIHFRVKFPDYYPQTNSTSKLRQCTIVVTLYEQ